MQQYLPESAFSIAVVIPCFKAGERVFQVIDGIGNEVDQIYVVDDACPLETGKSVQSRYPVDRVKVVFRAENGGVGAATMDGYRAADRDGVDIVVKMDADGQMDPTLIGSLVAPIKVGEADYCKGNRFYNPAHVRQMPLPRLVGNAVLSFMTKISSGYWTVFDPTNGYTAIHTSILSELGLEKVSTRFFFESDLLFRLNLIRAKVQDVPMVAIYGDEESTLSVGGAIPSFLWRHARNVWKRIIYNYFLRDFSVASLALLLGLMSCSFGFTVGAIAWGHALQSGEPATSGTVMLAGLPFLAGFQLLLMFLAFDVAAQPSLALHPILSRRHRVQMNSSHALKEREE